MKHIFILSIIFLFKQTSLISQTIAVTDKGEEVFLYDNGTWKYKNSEKSSWNTRVDTVTLKKDVASTFLLKGEKFNYGVWLNPKKWKFKKKGEASEATEFQFSLIGEDAYAMIVAERIEVPMNDLKNLAFKNALKVSPDVKIVYEDVRLVNGLLVNCMELEGTISGIKFSYFNYYYSSSIGTIQFVTYTSQNLLKKYKPELENLLNGLVVLKK